MDESNAPKDANTDPNEGSLPNRCPKCGKTFPAGLSICPDDGTALVLNSLGEIPTPNLGGPTGSPRSATMVVDADSMGLGVAAGLVGEPAETPATAEPVPTPSQPPPAAPTPAGPPAPPQTPPAAETPTGPPVPPQTPSATETPAGLPVPPPVAQGEPTVPVVPSGDLKPMPTSEEVSAEAAADAEPADPLVGKLLRDKWEVLERVGSGSFGTVYKVRDVKGGWIDALKILSVDRLVGIDAEHARQRFLREAQLVNRLGKESAHIVGLSTYEEDLGAGLIYFLMDFVEGKSLGQAVRADGVFSPARAIRLGLQVCDALIVAHEGDRPVVHRDLKLENIMLTPGRGGEEVAKVLDFGIAKIVEREQDSRLTEAGTSLGTPGFAAPEQLRAGDVDGRTDLFAFGVILYNILTGKDPWLGEPAGSASGKIYELMVASERGEVLPIEETGVDVPPELAQIVLKLMAREPDDRFSSARELRDALNAIQVETEASTPVADSTEKVRTRKKARFEGGVSLLPAAVVGVLLVLGLFAVRPWGRTLELSDLQSRATAGEVSQVRITADGLGGRVPALGFLSSPFRTPVPEGDIPGVVEGLRTAGIDVDASWAVNRLVDRAVEAQAAMHYFGNGGDDVQGYAQEMETLDPGNLEAQSLLLKVAERMAWDAEAAFEAGSTGVAQALLRDCRTLVPNHPRCEAVAAGG